MDFADIGRSPCTLMMRDVCEQLQVASPTVNKQCVLFNIFLTQENTNMFLPDMMMIFFLFMQSNVYNAMFVVTTVMMQKQFCHFQEQTNKLSVSDF